MAKAISVTSRLALIAANTTREPNRWTSRPAAIEPAIEVSPPTDTA